MRITKVLIISVTLILVVQIFVTKAYSQFSEFNSDMREIQRAGDLTENEKIDYAFRVTQAYRDIPASTGVRLHAFCQAIVKLEITGMRDKKQLLEFATGATIAARATLTSAEFMGTTYGEAYRDFNFTVEDLYAVVGVAYAFEHDKDWVKKAHDHGTSVLTASQSLGKLQDYNVKSYLRSVESGEVRKRGATDVIRVYNMVSVAGAPTGPVDKIMASITNRNSHEGSQAIMAQALAIGILSDKATGENYYNAAISGNLGVAVDIFLNAIRNMPQR